MITSRIQPSGIGTNHWAKRKITIAAVIGAVMASPATAREQPDVGDLADADRARA